MGVVASQGHVVHLTGQVAWDADENIIGLGDVAVQARACLQNISDLLGEVGGTMDDIVSITTWYTAPDQLALIQPVRNEFFKPGKEPASTSVMVAGLGHKDFLVEMTPVAIIPASRFKSRVET